MASGEEIVIHSHNKSNPPACAAEAKPTLPALTWLSMIARKAGTACLATLVQPVTGPVLIACVCLATLAYNKRKCTRDVQAAQKAARRPTVLHRSMSIAALHGGKMALERIMDAQEARIDEAGLPGMLENMRELLSRPHISFKELHRVAAKLEMSGKESHAIEMLKDALNKAHKEKHLLEAYELEMLLVEMLIYKGEYDKALLCKCLKEKGISDARAPLYQAVIYTIKDDKRCARKYYDEFQSIRKRFHWPDGIEEGSPLYGIVLHFEDFERIVENLKKEIEHVHNHRAK